MDMETVSEHTISANDVRAHLARDISIGVLDNVIDRVDSDSDPQNSSTSLEREALLRKFNAKISPNLELDRSLVSNQANKKLPFYGWFRYREGFSEPFVQYILNKLLKQPGILLDPFSGAGSTLFAATVKGWKTKGIEVLPVGNYATQTRFLTEKINVRDFRLLIEILLLSHRNLSVIWLA